MAYSPRLRELLIRIQTLENHFLPTGLKFSSTGQYSPLEEDHGRAYVLLVHAEIEAYFEEIGAAGITTAVSTSGQTPAMTIGGRVMAARTTSNDLMARLQNEHWGRFIGVAGIDCGNVLHNALDEIARSHKLGLRIVFIEPGRSPGCDIDDRRLYPIYEKCLELDMVLFPQTTSTSSSFPRCTPNSAILNSQGPTISMYSISRNMRGFSF